MKRNHKNGRRSPDSVENLKGCAPETLSGPAAAAPRAEPKLELPIGEPDLEALRSVTREWLVPVLVEEFLREQGVGSNVRPENTACQFIDRDGGAGTTPTAGSDASASAVHRSRQKRSAAECQRTRKTSTER